jgi:soluble lytic murein transglycosylase-like protein
MPVVKIDTALILGKISLIAMISVIPLGYVYGRTLENPVYAIENPPAEVPALPEGYSKVAQTRENVVNLIKIYWDKSEVDGALAVAKCESGFNPKAKNPNSTASGVFQIIKGTFKQFKCEGYVFDAEDNVKCARKIYDY